jgi:hypothetical protein
VVELAEFDAMAAVVHPRRQRLLSAEQKQACAERLAKFWFPPARQSGISKRQAAQHPEGDPGGI